MKKTFGFLNMKNRFLDSLRSLEMTKWLRLVALSLLAPVLFSCGESSGLGPEVDVVAPTVSVTSHADDDTVPSVFTLSGTAWDNNEVNLITVDFEDADLHYKIVPGGVWQKKTASLSEWQDVEGEYGSCTADGQTWTWKIRVDTTEKSGSKTDNTFEFSAIASDKMGNSGKNSKVERSLTVDTENPEVTLNSPSIFTGTFSEASESAETYNLKDGNVISKLLNGELTFTGRQANSISFKELLIEFDDGALEIPADNSRTVTGDSLSDKTELTAQEVAEAVSFENDTKTTAYYSKLLKKGEDGIVDLRNWSLTVPMSEWVSGEKNPELKTGRHLIRIVTTSVSDSYAWERKVLGYFVWWPEADVPWITTYIGDDEDKGESAYEVYPSSNLSGTVQDDDGIESLSYVIKKKGDDGEFADYSNGDFNDDAAIKENAKYSAWTVRAPSENGNYSLTVTVTDTNGNSDSVTKYFKTLDVSPPKIEISSPESGSSVLAESDGTVKFRGKVTDDGTVTSFYVAFLNQNPKVNTAVQNKINFMSGNAASAAWSSGTEKPGFTDADGNTIYKIDLGEPEQEKTGNVYSFSQEFDLFSDLGIDGKEKTLDAIDFIFRAEDNGGTNTVEVFTLSGDTEAPVVSIDTLILKDGNESVIQSYNFADDTTPTLPVIKNGDTATISGTWSDNSTTLWNDSYKLKILPLKLTWTDTEIAATLSANGTWSAEVSNALLPTTSGIIKAVLTDYAGNAKTATRSVFIESAETGLESIGCENDDGAYGAGTEIKITLEFTKSTTVTYDDGKAPTLTLNNGKTATYVSGTEEAKHVYKYTVETGDNIERLDVIAINTNGAIWTDKFTNTAITVELPAQNKRIGTTRNIKIDTTAPTVKSVEAITAEGSYKAGSQIFLKLTFSENVSFTNSSGEAVSNLSEALKLAFTHNATTDMTSLSGSNSVIFVYTVKDGDNANPLTLKEISAPTGLEAKDEAGNSVSSWTLPASSSLGKNIVIDTDAPSKPTVNGAWGNDSVIIDSNGTSFTVTGTEEGATVEYSLDGGSNWITYPTGGVSLTNNGTYTITAQQTDKAGNVSGYASLQTVTVDKGDLLTAITASTVSGSYSLNTNTKSVEGLIKFRAPVTIGSGATVTLNVKNNSSSYSGDKTERKVSINSAGTASNSYTFTYEIQEGDYIESNGKLDVTGWNFDSVTYFGKSVSMKFDDVATGTKKFASNREIYILTGKPTVQSVSLTGEGSAAVLKVTFDRQITKNTGNITFTQEEESYRIPAVLTASEYSTIPSGAKNSYTKGTNGATESGGKLTNDTSTKYILNYDKETDDSTLVGYFISAGKHIVSVPVVSSAVVASGKTLIITLGENYALPTMGATYTLDVPAAAVSDEAQNKNAEYETDGSSSKLHLTSEGVEKPEIRIKKGSQTITPGSSPSFTTGAKVSMPTTAQMKISCRTPNATIKYGISGSMSGTTATGTTETVQTVETNYNAVKNNGSPTVVEANTEYNTEITLGGSITAYADATGAKFAISAVATKGSVTSETSYEYAARTVLKFKINGIYGNDNAACNYIGTSAIKEGTATLTYGQLKVWVQGGDATSGGNSLDPFPLSWGESSNFKLMAGSHPDGTANMNGEWYWVTWDLSAPAYHGFVIGDVPSDAASNGPTTWYAANCGWATAKSSYPLYPGETLEMISSTISNTYQFASNLKCTRN